jgi:hypothetical protein
VPSSPHNSVVLETKAHLGPNLRLGSASYTLHCRSIKITMFALSSHASSSMSINITFIDNFTQILGCFIAIPINVSRGSISIVDGVLHPIGCSFVLIFLTQYIVFFLECETTLYHSTMTILLLLYFLFHYVELQLDPLISTNFKSPCDSCLLAFYHFDLEIIFCHKLKSLQQQFCSNVNPNNILNQL